MKHVVRNDMRAYAAFREGQDRTLHDNLARRMLAMNLSRRKLKLTGEPLRAYAAFRTGQDRVRPDGNHGLYFHRRSLYG
ncbi:hypothetical protein [Aestuariispira ectoiniformans]|uniref:hypothetical protein n=1 Tax=Aestuariispira ectoiniformans TaxID=2775080 RepID=UPI00223AE855|nr:hypothetical protein [Aestuariispira ectoiniformans]